MANSEISKHHFCKQLLIGLHKFNYWLKKYKEEFQNTPPGLYSLFVLLVMPYPYISINLLLTTYCSKFILNFEV